jgi:hypothetical protein
VHDATGTLVVATSVQVVAVQEFAELAATAVQAPPSTGVGPLVDVLQVVAVYALAELAACGVQELDGVGPVPALLQVVVV